MDLSRAVSEINGDFGQKWQIFNAPLRGFPLEFCNGGAAKNYSDAPTRWSKKSDDRCIRLDTIWRRDGRTDGQKRYTTILQSACCKSWRAIKKHGNCYEQI